MSYSARSSLFGRQAWRSLSESLDFLGSKASKRQHATASSSFRSTGAFYSSAPGGRASYFQPWSFSRPPKGLHSHNARRSFTSSGLLLIGLSPSSSTTSNVVASCATAAETAVSSSTAQSSSVSKLARQAWQRGIHTGRVQTIPSRRRFKSTKSSDDVEKTVKTVSATTTSSNGSVVASKDGKQPKDAPEMKPSGQKHPDSKSPDGDQQQNSLLDYFHLPNLPPLPNIPHLPHRPTKEEFLAAANGFFERLRVRFKWYSIRSMRPWNSDEWGAFLSFFLFGHLVWILLGTTTFVSLVILSINTVVAQETLAKWVGDYLTQSAGISVIFESAIVPRWKDGVISFRNVFVSRRPGQVKSSVSKGSSSNAAAVAAAERDSEKEAEIEEDDGNYTQFDVTLDTVNVTLSFVKWWNGQGPLKDVEVKGVRGVVDRTSVVWNATGVDPLSYRREQQEAGDFEIENFKLEDLLVTIHQPGGFRPFSVSIYSCELPQLRKHYLFYDMIAASHMSGSFDGSLFTIHPRQVHGVAPGHERIGDDFGEPAAWKKFSRLRIDGLKIDHLNRGDPGPFGWIYEGNVDIVADVMFPADSDEGLGKVMSDFYDRLEEAVTSNRILQLLDSNSDRDNYGDDDMIYNDSWDSRDGESILQDTTHEEKPENQASTPPAPTPPPARSHKGEQPRYLVMDLRIHLNDVKASVPVFTPDLSYVNQALVRPIVAYINTKKTYIPIGCRVVKRASDFDGAWTIFDSGLMTDLSAEVYTAFVQDIEDQRSRIRRLKKVGIWTLSLAVHALFMGMAGNVI